MKKNILILLFCIVSSTFGFSQGENLLAPDYKPFGLPLGNRVASFDLIDINNDQIPDVAASIIHNDSSALYIKLGPDFSTLVTNPDFKFSFLASNPFKNTAFYLAWSDIDMDNDYDLYIGQHAEYLVDAKIFILENQSSGTLNFVLNSSFVFDLEDIVAIPSPIDYDDDGKEDLFISDFAGQVSVYKNNGGFSFTKLAPGSLGLDDFNIRCAFDELSNSKNLIGFDLAHGFNLFLFDGSTYTRDTNNIVISNPDELNTMFIQPRIRDLDNDGLTDAFLSSNTFTVNNGYYTDTWLYKGVCVDSLVKDEIPIISANYTAEKWISSAGEIDSPQGVYFRAGEAIEIKENFVVKLGALFEAIIATCPSNE